MSSIKLNNLDNVAVLLEGTSTTPVFHKVATKDIICGQNIIKYGNPIGKATADIKIGEHVHTHNLKSSLNDILEYKYTPTKRASAITQYKQFSGFKTRQDAVGIRNDIFIIPTVG